MNWKQLTGLSCSHRTLSIPINRRQHCIECGETFVFDQYDLSEIDHRTTDHYVVSDRSVRRLLKPTLKWRRKA